MRIQHNLTNMEQHRKNVRIIGGNLRNMEKMSSGYESAGADAGGLTISEKVRVHFEMSVQSVGSKGAQQSAKNTPRLELNRSALKVTEAGGVASTAAMVEAALEAQGFYTALQTEEFSGNAEAFHSSAGFAEAENKDEQWGSSFGSLTLGHF